MYWSNPYQRKARKKEGKGKKKHHYAHGPSGLGWPDSVFLGPIKMFETKKHILCLLAPEFKKKTTKLNRCSIKMSAKLNTMSTSLMAKFSIHKNSITLDTSLKGRSFSPQEFLGACDDCQEVLATVNKTRYPWPSHCNGKRIFKDLVSRDFPGGSVVRTSPSSAGGSGSIPGGGTKIPHATGLRSPCGQLGPHAAKNK